ncbi:DEAD-box type RNA helicase, partial [Elasticomyces elasticus]
MAEHIEAIRALQALDPDIHIFCPRSSTDLRKQQAFEFDEKGRQQLADAKARRDQFFSALPLLAYDGAECTTYHQWLYDTLDRQLGKCELCVRNYYLGKLDFVQHLLQEYDQDEVNQFLDILNRRDIARIEKGLNNASRTLEAAQPQQRTSSILAVEHLFALFEALHCEPFLNDEQRLRDHFDKPFKLVQTKKPLRTNELLPATTKFLFSTNAERLTWAAGAWEKIDQPPTNEEWDWAIKNILQKEFASIRDEQGLIRTWSALNVIVEKLSKEQIKLKLFDLNFKVPKRALENLAQHATMAVPQILSGMQSIWTKAPVAYWQEMSSVSPATVAETVFNTANFDKCLEQQASSDAEASKTDVLSWVEPFMDSLPVAGRLVGARTVAYQLTKRTDSDKISSDARQLCFYWKLKSLLSMTLSFSNEQESLHTIARPIIMNVVQINTENLESILSFKVPASFAQQAKCKEQVLNLAKNTLWLECQTIKIDSKSIADGKPRVQNCSYTPELWQITRRYMQAEWHEFSQSVLQGIVTPLTGLEAFVVTGEKVQFKKEKESFNDIFGKVEQALTTNVEKLAEFPSSHLDHLFASQHTNMALIALLFSGNDSIYNATIELIKNISDEPARKEALSHLLKAFPKETLYSICWVFKRIAGTMAFAPVPRLLKTGMDIMDLLCDTTGILRGEAAAKSASSAIKSYWSYSWTMLQIIFRRMEKWSIEQHNKVLMTEVCRDTMQYAQQLFDHYYLFAKIVEQTKPDLSADQVAKQLLSIEDKEGGSPPRALDNMVRWLRLKDPYLAEMLVNLIIKILPKLKEYGTQLPDNALCLESIEHCSTVGSDGRPIRTILDENQKAQLVRALEQYTGRQIASKQLAMRIKQQKLAFGTKSSSASSRDIITIDDDEASVK